ncbi:MAG TPA: dihydropteroate synthase [Nitrospina sp.]|jgi:dihydropteroate synthase|nr:dihydropteroate synthase [Nitrospinaceae bacterium]HAX47237.1 dihydropteroate synthase [Nitrospina sp.]|tara:strand:- start:723 stop:1556 length:834 start_codon:yes stop_codon:yes gene_type:complete
MAFSFDRLTESGCVAVMGILNLSPDSFYSGNRSSNPDDVLRFAEQMVEDGAHILDVGAESTRPGTKEISVELELKRLLPVISKLASRFSVQISVDTSKFEVADVVLQEGATLINDVTGLRKGKQMSETVSRHGAGIVIMHMQGTPESMQNNPEYNDVGAEVLSFLRESVKTAESTGIIPESIAVDPGIGFGKTLNHNLALIARLGQLKELKKKILLGVSRKSFIGKILDLEVEDRLEGSLAAGIAGVMNGADILRVHDVAATVRAVRVAQAIRKVNN